MKPSDRDLKRLLKAALGLAQTPDSPRGESIRLGDARFKLMTEQHKGGGWIVVLVQEKDDELVCGEVLKECFGLTSREVDVVRLLAERYSNPEIAQALGITKYTVGRHVEKVLRKLGVGSRKDVGKRLKEIRALR